jgi:hypothetical protein
MDKDIVVSIRDVIFNRDDAFAFFRRRAMMATFA